MLVCLKLLCAKKECEAEENHSSDTIAFQFSCCQSWKLPQASVTSSKKVCLGSAESWCFCWDPGIRQTKAWLAHHFPPCHSMSTFNESSPPKLGEGHLGTEQGLQRSTAGACTKRAVQHRYASPMISSHHFGPEIWGSHRYWKPCFKCCFPKENIGGKPGKPCKNLPGTNSGNVRSGWVIGIVARVMKRPQPGPCRTCRTCSLKPSAFGSSRKMWRRTKIHWGHSPKIRILKA